MSEAGWRFDERGAVLQLASLAVVLEVEAPIDVPDGLPEVQADTLATVLEDPEGWVDRARAFVADLDIDVAPDALTNVELRIPAREPLLAFAADWSDDPEHGLSVLWWRGRARRWGGRVDGLLWSQTTT